VAPSKDVGGQMIVFSLYNMTRVRLESPSPAEMNLMPGKSFTNFGRGLKFF